MGQKVHPKSFRLITTQKHLSNWYSKKKTFSLYLKEDFFIRTTLENMLENYLLISSIQISRTNSELNFKNNISININCFFPREKDISKKWFAYLENILNSSQRVKKKYLQLIKNNPKGFSKIFLLRLVKQFRKILQFKSSNSLSLSFTFIKNQFEDSMLIAKFIGNLIEKRIPYRRAINIALKKALATSIKGIKIQISGRLNGTDIARTEWKREGKISLHTLNSVIDYAQHSQHSIYGLFGIKVWLLK